jgi:D-alanyl-D-alanine carboxypeptidase/D-alanyl-D-alanine-endopeptidase (penicillin-binding protein 4)
MAPPQEDDMTARHTSHLTSPTLTARTATARIAAACAAPSRAALATATIATIATIGATALAAPAPARVTATVPVSAAPVPPGATSVPPTFNALFDATRARAAFAHAIFGAEIYDLRAHRVLYQFNGDKLFAPGSTAKLLTEGAALAILGPDYRFHTSIYRTGDIADHTLNGSLILVASGDPNLSARPRPDGTLAFADDDHSYGGFGARLVPGDPAAPLRDLARQIAASGISRITGGIVIDTSLFPEGVKEAGTGVTISPICVNDNMIDITITPGPAVAAPAVLTIAPQVPSVHVINQMATGVADSALELAQHDAVAADGTTTITVAGYMPMGRGSTITHYAVPSPARFAAALMAQALAEQGVAIATPSPDPPPDARHFLTPAFRVADYVSAPLSQDVKVTLKTSQNLHAAMMPSVIGALRGHEGAQAERAGFALERQFLSGAGLDLTGVTQSDGAGGNASVTPDFMVRYLGYVAAQPYAAALHDALPILGRDGSLHDTAINSPAAGHVFAKTGTLIHADLLNSSALLNAKALAGYTTTQDGTPVAFALFVNNVPLRVMTMEDIKPLVSEPLAEIAASINLLPIQ